MSAKFFVFLTLVRVKEYILIMEKQAENRSIIPQKWKVLSGSALKTIALVCMIIDHTASYLRTHFSLVLFTTASGDKTLYWLMRFIGRLAFPIYCFLLVEGFIHTRDRKKYGLRLLIFAVISEIPWNLAHAHKLLYSSQNVFFTLLLGYCGMWVYEYFREDRIKQFAGVFALLLVSLFLEADYGMSGYGFILMMYILRENKILQAAIGCCFLSSTWMAGLAFIPINLYNGERGFIKSRVLQLIYYAIYPVHLFIFYLITK